jgi:Fe-S-cluster-containing hydrogenase component 2
MTFGKKTAVLRRLHAGRGLMHEEGACLPLRSRHGQCDACADACPSAALQVTVDAVTLGEACTGCGRCTAACPTQALSLPELAAPPPVETTRPAGDRARLHIECRKVPADRQAAGTWVLPCLGALTPGHLLALAAAGTEVTVVDRGWCPGCDAAGNDTTPEHPGAAALATAGAWLEAVGVAEPPRLVAEPLPLALRPVSIPALADETPVVDRRRFFRAALDRPAGRAHGAAAPMGGDGRAAYPAHARAASPERLRQHAALVALAGAHASAVPAEFFPALHVDEASCCDRRMCVALCPTAALTVADDGTSAHLRFDPVACIACGTCVRACPEGSLALQAHGGLPEPQTLLTHRRQRCAACGDGYTARGHADAEAGAGAGAEGGSGSPALSAWCPACTKSHRFIDDARRQLFGALHRPAGAARQGPGD